MTPAAISSHEIWLWVLFTRHPKMPGALYLLRTSARKWTNPTLTRSTKEQRRRHRDASYPAVVFAIVWYLAAGMSYTIDGTWPGAHFAARPFTPTHAVEG